MALSGKAYGVKHKRIDPIEDKKKLIAERAKEKSDRVLVKDLFERWAATDLINRKDQGEEARRMMEKDVLPFIGEMDVKDVRKLHVAEITDRLLQRGVKRMAKVVFSLIRQMFRFAVTRDLLESDPTAMVSKKNIGGANIERERVLSEEEIRELARKLPLSQMIEMNVLAIWITLATCCRIGELLKARWNHVSIERNSWLIPAENSKNQREHIVHLSPFALRHFMRLRELSGDGEWCYPASRGDGHICSKTITKQITDRQRTGGNLKNRSKNISALTLSKGVWKPHDLRRTGACIVGEPTGMVPVIAHKGINSFRCRIHGHAAHSSLTPKGCNAIEYGVKLICWLRSFAEQLKEKGVKDDLYDVPYTTLTSTMVSGGIAMNTIPSFLEFLFEFRNLPHDNPTQISQAIKDYVREYLIPEMQKESVDASVEIEPINCIPAFQTFAKS